LNTEGVAKYGSQVGNRMVIVNIYLDIYLPVNTNPGLIISSENDFNVVGPNNGGI
jgi:hypothetical protein